MKDEEFMKIAIQEAKKGDFPFGAVIVKGEKIIAKSHNSAGNIDPTAHAEINAIRMACELLKTNNLSGCILYSTCEPCPMCFTAAWWARISNIVYGAQAEDVKEDKWKIDVKCSYLNDKSGNRIEITGGVLRDECIKLLQ